MYTASTTALPAPLAEAMKETGVWSPPCPVALERLSLVRINYVDFEGIEHEDGEMIVLDAVAERVQRIFTELRTLQFPIAKIQSLHHYKGDDDASMADNNSSCFNFRQIAGSAMISMHGYGLAIDINPLQNPFLTFDEDRGIAVIHPPDGWQFLNRYNVKPGFAEAVFDIFAKNGFAIWGGRWTTPIDYHHFQPPRVVADLLLGLSVEDAAECFEVFAQHHKRLPFIQGMLDANRLLELYNVDQERFFDELIKSLR